MPRKTAPAMPVVQRAEDMNLMELRQHAGLRHRYTMRFITVNEHEQSHRLFPDRMDHTHKVPEPPPEEEPDEQLCTGL